MVTLTSDPKVAAMPHTVAAHAHHLLTTREDLVSSVQVLMPSVDELMIIRHISGSYETTLSLVFQSPGETENGSVKIHASWQPEPEYSMPWASQDQQLSTASTPMLTHYLLLLVDQMLAPFPQS